ncbi:hypothetical protein [Salmonella sp. NW1203]
MESARDKHTREIVEAEDLWLLDSVDTEGYVDLPLYFQTPVIT